MSKLDLFIDGIRIVDPLHPERDTVSVWIENGTVREIAANDSDRQALSRRVRSDSPSAQVLNGAGLFLFPGLVDVHVHFREPGFEYKETIRTGCDAAARGGFVAVCPMANTYPVNDNRAVTEFLLKKAAEVDGVHVHPIGAVSKGLEGKELAEFADMKEGGIVAVSDDGRPVLDSGLMRRALSYAHTFDLPVIAHCEDSLLCPHGAMHEGVVSTRLGLEGIPSEAEAIMIARDIQLARLTRGRLHIAHISTAAGVELVRRAKSEGLSVTAEATPHHLMLSHEVLLGVGAYDTNFKMNPPLREVEDVAAVRAGLREGVIDCIATDHAPHAADEKDVEFHAAPNGVVGLETAFAVGRQLVREGVLTYHQLAEKMSLNPSRIFKMPYGTIEPGTPAHLTIMDPARSFTVDPNDFKSKSRNSAFKGRAFQGDVAGTLVAGKWVYRAPWASLDGRWDRMDPTDPGGHRPADAGANRSMGARV